MNETYGYQQPYYNQTSGVQQYAPRSYTNYTTPTPTMAGNNTMVWVQGEAGANAYPMAPNTVAWLMDSNEPKLYVKRTDANGRYFPLERYKLVPEDAAASNPQYVTAEQLDQRLNELTKKFVIRKPRKENDNG